LLWSRAAKQLKWSPIKKALATEIAAGKWQGLEMVWNAWLQCHHGEDLSMVNFQPGYTLLKFLLRAGVAKSSLLIVSQAGARPLPHEIKQLGIHPRAGNRREGQAKHRLQISPSGIDAKTSSGATLSVLGVHWSILVMGSILLTRKKADI
jgi:hypothetical protein